MSAKEQTGGGVVRVRSAAVALEKAVPLWRGDRYDLLGQAMRLLAVAVPLRWEPGRPPYKAAWGAARAALACWGAAAQLPAEWVAQWVDDALELARAALVLAEGQGVDGRVNARIVVGRSASAWLLAGGRPALADLLEQPSLECLSC